MRIGLFSDTHLFNWKNFGTIIPETGLSKRLVEQTKALQEISTIFKKQQVDFTIFGGDWTHSVGTVQNQVLNVSMNMVQLFDNLLVLDGNHDTPVRVLPKPAHIFTNLIRNLSDDIAIPKNIKFVSFYEGVDYEKIVGYDLVVLHKTPYGSKVGNYTFDEGINWKRLAENNKMVAFGHVHEMQMMSDNCFVIGSPYHLTFGDIGDRGCFIVDTDKGTAEFFKVDSPKFLTVNSDEEAEGEGNYYRVLNSKVKTDKDNVISVVKPKAFEERIKADSFYGILEEWLTFNEKPKEYLDVIKDLIDEKLQSVHTVFKGKLKGVSIQNFGSVGRIDYSIKNGFTLVAGTNDMFDSNGSGKTTATGEAICWALFGVTTKGLTGDDVIMRGEKDCSVELDLLDNECDVILTRTRKAGLSIKIVRDGQTTEPVEGMKQSDRQKYLEQEVLGFDKNTYLASCYFSQENLVMLTGLSDLDKTNMITNLLGFESYEDLYTAVRDRITGCEDEVSVIDTKGNYLEREHELQRAKMEMSQQYEDELKIELAGIDNKVDDILEEKAELNKRLKQVKDPENLDTTDYVASREHMYAEEKTRLSNVEALRNTLGKIASEESVVESDIRMAMADKGRHQKDIDRIEIEIANLNSLEKGEKCDKCGATVSEENIGVFVNEKKQATSALISEISKSDTAIIDNKKAIEKHKEDSTGVEIERDVHLAVITTIQKNIRTTQQKELEQLEAKQEAELRREKIEGQIANCTNMIREHVTSQGTVKEKIKRAANDIILANENTLKLLTAAKEAQVEVQKLKVRVEKFDFWKIAFSAKGIRAVLLDRFCNEFNSVVNTYLSQVSNGRMGIILTPTKTTKGGDERNKIGMVVSLDSNEVEYISLSGGEKRRVNASLCFGLNAWIGDKYKLDYGLLGIVVFDEVFAFLDKSGEETIAQLLHEEGVNKAIFVIDHGLALDAYADRIWKVSKTNGVSTLEIGE